MTDDVKPEPHLTPAAARARAEREARQADALRANLRRRKTQARDRKDQSAETAHKMYPDVSDSAQDC